MGFSGEYISIGGDNVEGSHNLLSLAMYVSLRCYGSTKGSR